MTEPKPDLSWPVCRRELRMTVIPPPDGAVTADGDQVHSVDLSYRWEPATAAETGVPENGWAFVQVEVFDYPDWGRGVHGPRRLITVYDENALNSPLGQVPDWIYALLREHEPPTPGELEASAEDAWRNVHEMQRELDSLQQRLGNQLTPTGTPVGAIQELPLPDGVRGALRMLHEEASRAVSRGLTQAYAVGLSEGEKRAQTP